MRTIPRPGGDRGPPSGLQFVGRGRLGPILFPVTFALLGLAAVVFVYRDYSRERAAVMAANWAELEAIAALKVSEIATWSAERRADARVTARDPFLVAALERWLAGRPGPGEIERIEARLDSIREEYAYLRVLVVDLAGRVRLQVGPDLAASDAVTDAVPDAPPAIAGGDELALRLHRAGAEIHLELTVGLRPAPEAAPVGYLKLQSDPNRFLYPLIRRWPTASPTGEAVLVERDGDQVVFLNGSRRRPGTALRLRFPVDQPGLPAAQAVQGREGPMTGVDSAGRPVLAVARPVSDSPWFLVAHRDREEIDAPLIGAARRAGLLSLALVALAGLALRAEWERRRRRSASQVAESEDRYQRLFTSALEGMALHELVTDAEGRAIDYVFLEVNPAFEKLTGLRREDVEGRRVTQVLPGIESDGFIETFGRVVSTGEGVTFERPATPLGRTFEVSAFHTGGLRFAALFTDVTKRQETTARLRLLGAALAATANAVLITDRAGMIVWVNDAFARLTGWRLEDCRGKTPRILKSGRHDQAFYAEMWKTILSGGVWQAEMLNRRRDGEVYTEEQTITPVVDERGEISHFIAVKVDATEQRKFEKALEESEERYRVLAEAASDGIMMVDEGGRVSFANGAALVMFGYTQEELIGQGLARLMPAELGAHHRESFDRYLETGERKLDWNRVEQWGLHKSGREFPIEMSYGEVLVGGQRTFVGIVRDTSARLQMEQRLRRSQTMEAVGHLSSGIAHDFNNLLGVIGGYSALALRSMPNDDSLKRQLVEIQKAGERAAVLTRQLLALGRDQPQRLEVLDVGSVVAGVDGMLRRVIREDIEFVTSLDTPDCRVEADRGQLEQVLLNLVVNARDAMPEGGRLVIQTATVELDEAYCRAHAGMSPGPFVLLAVSDTGTGIDAATRERMFEPFFTTKEEGKGTGLGLATVYGIVKQHGGDIWVYSEPRQGTTFKVYLPQVAGATGAAEAARSAAARGAGETVLLVEDDAALREVTLEVLEGLGYAVLGAQHGEEALEQATRHPERIDVLVTDMVMPGLAGRAVAERLRAIQPDVRVLFVSGYTDEVAVRGGELEAGMAFLEKPFTPDALARKLREVLDAEPGGEE